MIVCRTPFRVSFLGGGTDFPVFFNKHGGCCISTTINKYSYIYLRRIDGLFGVKNEFIYSQFERTDYDLDSIKHPIIREGLKSENLNGLRIDYDADIPARTGLGTSSSFSVGLVNALNAMKGVSLSKRQIADKAIFLERVLCKEAGGIQDQIASSYGGLNIISFSADGYTVENLKLQDQKGLQDNLLMFYTGIQRSSSEVQKRLDPQKKEHNLLQLKEVTERGVLSLRKGKLDEFGSMLGEAWNLKRSLSSSVSSSLIDEYYDKAISAGALGGKILGAGGGGFFLFYVPRNRQEAVRSVMHNLLELPFNFEYSGSQILLNTGY